MTFLALAAAMLLMTVLGEALPTDVFVSVLIGTLASLVFIMRGWKGFASILGLIFGGRTLTGSTAQKVWLWLEAVIYVQVLILPPWILFLDLGTFEQLKLLALTSVVGYASSWLRIRIIGEKADKADHPQPAGD